MNLLKKVRDLFNKYRQAEWRTQRQLLGLFMLGLVVSTLLAGFYLNVVSRAAIIGREIGMLRSGIETKQQENAILETEYAAATSEGNMRSRAWDLGYRPVEPENITYVAVPSYLIPHTFTLPENAPDFSEPLMKPEYSESLFDWFGRWLENSVPAESVP